MIVKKRVFIGSSSEELELAEIVKGQLEPEFDVTIWNEKIWNKSVFKLNSGFKLIDFNLNYLTFHIPVIPTIIISIVLFV